MSDSIAITHDDQTTHGTYSAPVEGADKPAVLTWTARGEARIAEHTFTPPEARGKGIALALVKEMVADAHEHGFTIEPQCPYVEAQFRKHADWADVRAAVPE